MTVVSQQLNQVVMLSCDARSLIARWVLVRPGPSKATKVDGPDEAPGNSSASINIAKLHYRQEDRLIFFVPLFSHIHTEQDTLLQAKTS